MWRIARSRTEAVLTIELFEQAGRDVRDAVADEGGRLLAFAAPDAQQADIRFAPIVTEP